MEAYFPPHSNFPGREFHPLRHRNAIPEVLHPHDPGLSPRAVKPAAFPIRKLHAQSFKQSSNFSPTIRSQKKSDATHGRIMKGEIPPQTQGDGSPNDIPRSSGKLRKHPSLPRQTLHHQAQGGRIYSNAKRLPTQCKKN